MKKKWMWIVAFSLIFFLSGCGTLPQDSDNSKDLTQMVAANQGVMASSKQVQQNVISAVKLFNSGKISFPTLKNIVKDNQDMQRTLIDKINSAGTTDLRQSVSDAFDVVINSRIQNYDELLSAIRMQDKTALMNAESIMESTDANVQKSQLVLINQLLTSKKVTNIKTLEK